MAGIGGEGDQLLHVVDYAMGEGDGELGELGDDFSDQRRQVASKPREEMDGDVPLQ